MIEENKTPRALVSSEDLEYVCQRKKKFTFSSLASATFFKSPTVGSEISGLLVTVGIEFKSSKSGASGQSKSLV